MAAPTDVDPRVWGIMCDNTNSLGEDEMYAIYQGNPLFTILETPYRSGGNAASWQHEHTYASHYAVQRYYHDESSPRDNVIREPGHPYYLVDYSLLELLAAYHVFRDPETNELLDSDADDDSFSADADGHVRGVTNPQRGGVKK